MYINIHLGPLGYEVGYSAFPHKHYIVSILMYHWTALPFIFLKLESGLCFVCVLRISFLWNCLGYLPNLLSPGPCTKWRVESGVGWGGVGIPIVILWLREVREPLLKTHPLVPLSALPSSGGGMRGHSGCSAVWAGQGQIGQVRAKKNPDS